MDPEFFIQGSKSEVDRDWNPTALIVSEILYYVWDPIGVSPDQVRREYEDYVPPIVGMLLRGTTEETLVQHLLEVAREMGLGGRLNKTRAAAKALISRYENYKASL